MTHSSANPRLGIFPVLPEGEIMTTTHSRGMRAAGRCLLGMIVFLSCASRASALTFSTTVGTNVLTVDPGPVAIASVMGGGEWAFDMPWRLEPPYTSLPINLSIHDVSETHDPYDTTPMSPIDGSVPPVDHLCDMFVVINPANGTTLSANLKTFRYFPMASIGTHARWQSGFEESVSEKFHEIERSAKWPASSDGPAFHTLRRVWNGEAITAEDARMADTAEWHATTLMNVSGFPAGDYVVTAVGWIAQGEGGCPSLTTFDDYHGVYVPDFPRSEDLLGAQGVDYLPTRGVWQFANTFRVHFAQQPLPRFDSGWVYGDIHYHSQGTDNEGESGYSYRAVIQAMKAMGLDFIVASDHASSSDQLTDIDDVFADQLPDDLPYLPDWSWIKEKILDFLQGVRIPIETERDAARDMNPRRWKYMHHWINDANGVNKQVLSGNRFQPLASGLSNLSLTAVATDTRTSSTSTTARGTGTPQIFLGGEVDTIPEMSLQEGSTQLLRYGNGKVYRWGDACVELPSEFLTLVQYTTFDICPSRSVLIEPASTGDSYLLHDIQGLASHSYFARQHFIHIPVDPTRDDAFVASDTTQYGGAHRRLADILAEDYDAGKKGYLFLAHPVSAASGSGASRLGPDIVPYSDTQLMKAFRSPYFLGLQLWNEDTRLTTKSSASAFPMTETRFPSCTASTCGTGSTLKPYLGWAAKDENGQLSALHHGAATWDRMLLWGMNPSKTAGISWLPAGMPRPVYMAGGSDAHGDINFRREGSITGWSESTDTALGKPRNLVFVGANRPQPVDGGATISQPQVAEGFRTGTFTVTDGPALRIAIDRNGNNVIDAADTPMGGVADLASVPLLVEWKSTPEFGPVTSIDLYVGSQAGTLDGVVWAPSDHGTHGPDDPSGVRYQEVPDATGRIYKQLEDNYLLDQTGRLRIVPSATEGMGGVRKVVLSRVDYPIVQKACHTETTTTPPSCYVDIRGLQHCTKPVMNVRTVCGATSVTPAERIYVRAFARTASAVPVGTGSVAVQRFAYTNPIWVRPVAVNPVAPVNATLSLAR